MSGIQTFGSPDRYYATNSDPVVRAATGGQKPAYMAAFAPVARTLEAAVEQVVREFNVLAREALRAETGLKLNFQGRQQSVRIRVMPGLPQPLDALAREQPDPSLWAIYLHRALFETTREGLTLLLSQWNLLLPPTQRNLPGYEEVPDTSGQPAVQQSKLLLDRLLEKANAADLKNKLIDLNQDLLGAYFFNRGEIQVYWMAIGFFAGIIGRPVRELALITLIHELSHAYTHLGLDIDMQEWGTKEFAAADLRIVEGLAQFYTEGVIDRVKTRGGELQATFEALLQFQSEPYCCHRSWAKESYHRGETVRLAMVAARRHGILKYEDFERGLTHADGLLEPGDD